MTLSRQRRLATDDFLTMPEEVLLERYGDQSNFGNGGGFKTRPLTYDQIELQDGIVTQPRDAHTTSTGEAGASEEFYNGAVFRTQPLEEEPRSSSKSWRNSIGFGRAV
jgi:hypothetical protein